MDNEKQIVLFLKPNTTFSEIQLAAKINERHPEMGSPITVPYDEKNSKNPLVIFNKGIMGFTINRHDASFVFKEKDEEECLKIMEDIIDLSFDYELDYNRLGYISTHIHSKKDKDDFVKKFAKDPSILSEEFNLAWYKNDLIDSVRVNVWERHLTDKINNVEFVTVMDINTPMEKECNISSEFVLEFLKKCDKYIDSKIKERL